MQPVEIKKDIYWVGAVDWNIRDFHGYTTYKGSTYNSYLVKDEKIALFDGVKKGFETDVLHRVHNLGIKPGDIDYLVINHLEPDHSGGLPKLIDAIKPEKILCSPMGEKAMKAHYHYTDWPVEVVKTGQTLSLGSKTVHFLETRMLHWPDSMFSYLAEDKVLISSDAFGQHLATSERFNDELDPSTLMQHCAKYYANILLLYGPMTQKLLAKVREMGLEIDMICPDHGVIWRKDPMQIVEAYDRWSRQESVNKAVVAYGSMWHSTETMAKAVADGLIDQGFSVKLMDLAVDHRSDVMTEVLEAKVLAFGSATLNNGMLPWVADFMQYMKGLKPVGKFAAAFGSYGWSGEAVKEITAKLEEMNLNVVDPGVRHQYVPGHDALKACRELGVKLGQAAKAG